MDQVAFIWQLDYDMCAIVTIVLNFQQMMYRQANVDQQVQNIRFRKECTQWQN